MSRDAHNAAAPPEHSNDWHFNESESSANDLKIPVEPASSATARGVTASLTPGRKSKVSWINSSLTNFNEALQVLNHAHQHEVQSLKDEMEALRSELGQNGTPSQQTLYKAGSKESSSMPSSGGDFKADDIGAVAERNAEVATMRSTERNTQRSTFRRLNSAVSLCSSEWDRRTSTDVADRERRCSLAEAIPPEPTERRPSKRPKAASIAFPLHEVWKGKMSNLERHLHIQRRFSFAMAVDKTITTEELVVRSGGWLQSWIVHPSSIVRLMWDLASMTLLAYDVMAIPFVSSFSSPELDESSFLVNMTLITMIFWTVDVVASISTGYPDGKRIIMDPRSILRRYLRTWFLMDVILLSLDYSYIFSYTETTGGSSARLGRSLRILRFIRTLRLFRLLKLKRIIQEIQDHINTETVAIIFGIVKIIICLIVANHLVACGWNAIGNSVDELTPSWLKENRMATRTLAFQYTTALHWSLTQFTPASMEVFPMNTGERVYSVAVLIIAMVCFSSFVSILTASMMELRKIQNDGSRQFWLLRRYMRDWGVSKRTRLRIQRYCEYAYKRQKQRVQEQDVMLLGLLSIPLREEMKYETFATHLFVHPLFSACDDRTRIFSSAVSAGHLARDDQAFCCGVQARHMIFLSNGALEYILGSMEEDPEKQRRMPMPISEEAGANQTLEEPTRGGVGSEMVLEGHWVAEAVLWTPWIHLGDLFALQESQIVIVDAAKFGEAVQIARPLLVAVSNYATKFLETLNDVHKRDLTDLCHKIVSIEDVIEESGFKAPHSRTHLEDAETDMLSGFPKVINHWRRKIVGLFRASAQEPT